MKLTQKLTQIQQKQHKDLHKILQVQEIWICRKTKTHNSIKFLERYFNNFFKEYVEKN